jgi:hypothetical protein
MHVKTAISEIYRMSISVCFMCESQITEPHSVIGGWSDCDWKEMCMMFSGELDNDHMMPCWQNIPSRQQHPLAHIILTSLVL